MWSDETFLASDKVKIMCNKELTSVDSARCGWNSFGSEDTVTEGGLSKE